MTHLFSLLSREWRWLRRIRHRRGYGIHSPFAFNFVTGVVYERGTYYAYPRLRSLYRQKPHPSLRLKDCLLLFRLANFQRPQTAYLYGDTSALLTECLRAGSSHTLYRQLTIDDLSGAGRAGLIVATGRWEEVAPQLIEHLQPGGLLVLTSLNSRRKALWQRLLSHPNAQVTFDLYDFGLIFYRPELQRERYVVNYW